MSETYQIKPTDSAKCPKCGAISQVAEWEKATLNELNECYDIVDQRFMGMDTIDDPAFNFVSVSEATSKTWYICPECGEQQMYVAMVFIPQVLLADALHKRLELEAKTATEEAFRAKEVPKMLAG